MEKLDIVEKMVDELDIKLELLKVLKPKTQEYLTVLEESKEIEQKLSKLVNT